MNTLVEFLTSKNLVPQEVKIAEMTSKGLSNAEIGRELGMQECEVKQAMSEIYVKMNLTSRAQLIVQCLPYLEPFTEVASK